MSNRYDDRMVFRNDNEIYENLLEARDVKFIRHFNTPRMSSPSTSQMRQLQTLQHIWKTGDRFYKLAARYYISPSYWWVIAQFNKRPTEGHLVPGDVIYIPLPLETILGMYLR
jgi:nucleoid-associated protein YgaU